MSMTDDSERQEGISEQRGVSYSSVSGSLHDQAQGGNDLFEVQGEALVNRGKSVTQPGHLLLHMRRQLAQITSYRAASTFLVSVSSSSRLKSSCCRRYAPSYYATEHANVCLQRLSVLEQAITR
ncbi:hypothetical protein E2C01_030319 [Portunus trituberculatus]|uniref:Uncharacterized protein n=1 Tax=Portunus trituberculatus TaxID=210409 RepID=A0A5B7ERR8_PORTR|nr:hypothetical protein [Portunus trituberculatus]